jgi:uncharacterized integral membrane protein
MLEKLRPYVGWSLLAILGLFIVLNLHWAEVNLLILQVKMPTAILIALSAALGAGAAFAFTFVKKLRKPPSETPPAS